jgi:hypothetical protein
MSRKGPKGAKGPSEALKKEDVVQAVQAVVIADSFKGGFRPITYSVPTVCFLYNCFIILPFCNLKKNIITCSVVCNIA